MAVTAAQFKKAIKQWYQNIIEREAEYTHIKEIGGDLPLTPIDDLCDPGDPKQVDLYKRLQDAQSEIATIKKKQADLKYDIASAIASQFKARIEDELHLFNTIKEIEDALGGYRGLTLKIMDDAVKSVNNRGSLIKDGETLYYTMLWAVAEAHNIVDADEYNPLTDLGITSKKDQADFQIHFMTLVYKYRAIPQEAINKHLEHLNRQEKAGAKRAIKGFNADLVDKIKDTSLFMKVPQNPTITTLTLGNPTRPITINEESNTQTATLDKMIIESYFKRIDLKTGDITNRTITPFYNNPKAKMFFHTMLSYLFEYGNNTERNEGNITMNLKEYMKRRDLVNETEARKEIKEAIELLKTTRFDLPWDRRGYGGFSTIVGDGYFIENQIYIGRIHKGLIRRIFLMDTPTTALKFNIRHFPHAFDMILHISFIYRANEHDPLRIDPITKKGIITVENLISKTQIPSRKEDVKNSEYKRQIIKPFFDNLNAVSEQCNINYTLLSRSKEPIEGDYYEINIDDFLSAKLEIDFSTYPQNTARVEAKKQHIAIARKTKKAKATKKQGGQRKKAPAKVEP